jgi:hypothetical protein
VSDILGPQWEQRHLRHEKIRQQWDAGGFDVPPPIQSLAAEGFEPSPGMQQRGDDRRRGLRSGFNPGFNAPSFVAGWSEEDPKEAKEKGYLPERQHILELKADHPDPEKRMWQGGRRWQSAPPNEQQAMTPYRRPFRFRLRYHGPSPEELEKTGGGDYPFPEHHTGYGQANLADTDNPWEAMKASVEAMSKINRITGGPPRRFD